MVESISTGCDVIGSGISRFKREEGGGGGLSEEGGWVRRECLGGC